MSEQTLQHLFVYGTLCPGRPNEHILESIDGVWQQAQAKGYLHQQGWGATMGYPALVLSEQGEIVEGYVLSSSELQEHWPRLDEFEGDAYQRTLTEVVLDDQSQVKAYVYTLHPDIAPLLNNPS